MESSSPKVQEKQAELLKGATLWFTGLSGAGKSTLSNAIKDKLDTLFKDKNKVFILDGDVIRTGLNKDLGFSAEARAENIRRISEVSKLFTMAGQLVFVAFISPYQKDRDFARKIHQDNGLGFYECHISAPLQVCEDRDVKGLYKKARAGEIKNFTGISDPYEEPIKPELNVKTHEQSLQESVEFVLRELAKDGILRDNRHGQVAESLYVTPTAEEAKEYEGLKSIDIDEE
jgi:adenylylsulfate kinase